MRRLVKQWLGGGARGEGKDVEVRILMVCMGNICRSPSAEAVLRGKLQRAGLAERVLVDSAGMTDYHAGEPPDPRSTAHAALRGYDLKPLRARPVEPADFERFDWLLGMDEANLAWLRKRAPAGAAERCQLLLPFAGRSDGVQEVPDPYYGGPAGFEHVLDLVEDACERLLSRLARGELGRAAGGSGKT